MWSRGGRVIQIKKPKEEGAEEEEAEEETADSEFDKKYEVQTKMVDR